MRDIVIALAIFIVNIWSALFFFVIGYIVLGIIILIIGTALIWGIALGKIKL